MEGIVSHWTESNVSGSGSDRGDCMVRGRWVWKGREETDREGEETRRGDKHEVRSWVQKSTGIESRHLVTVSIQKKSLIFLRLA